MEYSTIVSFSIYKTKVFDKRKIKKIKEPQNNISDVETTIVLWSVLEHNILGHVYIKFQVQETREPKHNFIDLTFSLNYGPKLDAWFL